MRFLATGDIHISDQPNPESLKRTMTVLWDMISYAKKKDIPHIFFNGDIFDTYLPPINVQLEFLKFLKHCKESDLSIYIAAGNHDYEDIRAANPHLTILHLYKEYCERLAVKEPFCMREDNCEIHLVPWMPAPRFKAKLKEIVAGLYRFDPDDPKAPISILMTHQPLTEAAVNSLGIVKNQDLSRDDLMLDYFDWVVLSDYHEAQDFAENGFYMGAPISFKRNDTQQLGFWEFDSEFNEWEPVPLKTKVPVHKEWVVTEDDTHLVGYDDRDYNFIKCPLSIREEMTSIYPEASISSYKEEVEVDETSDRVKEGAGPEGVIHSVINSKIYKDKRRKRVLKRLAKHYISKVK